MGVLRFPHVQTIPTTSPSVSFGKGTLNMCAFCQTCSDSFPANFQKDYGSAKTPFHCELTKIKNIGQIAYVLPEQTFWQHDLIVCHSYFNFTQYLRSYLHLLSIDKKKKKKRPCVRFILHFVLSYFYLSGNRS